MQIQTQVDARRRVTRRPNFPIAGAVKPYGLYPQWVHPVLPGETLQSMSQKSRMISMPVKHPMVGAWQEHWLVYVKFTDLARDLGQMFISDTMTTDGYTADADQPRHFTKSGQIDWVQKCVDRIHKAYFIHENESPRTIDGVPMMKLNNVSWYQNAVFEQVDETVPVTDASDMYKHLQGWQMLQQMSMTELTYEKYLETYGVKSISEAQGDPEILRFARSWTQPVNTIEPSTGAPSSAFVWSDEIKMDKAKRFDEPGFLVMLTGIRPKMFQANLGGSMVGNLWGFSDWYPSYNMQDPTAGVKKLLKDDHVFASALDDEGGETVLYDHRDLLMHGEQFINSDSLPYDLPMSTGLTTVTGSEPEDLRGEYPKESDIDGIFSGADPRAYYEGMAHCVVSGHVADHTQ